MQSRSTAGARPFGELTPLLAPRSVAVIGASDREGNLGGVAVGFLSKFKFHGPIWPVNSGRSHVAGLPLFVLVHPSVKVTSIKELIALAKAQPGKLDYSSSGSGGSMHVAAELFKNMTGTHMVHIPYKGGGPAVADLLASQVPVSFATVLETLPHVKSGRLRALAVTSANRSLASPSVATVAESGVPEYESISWLALFAPAGTPKDIINKISLEVVRIINLPDVKERLLLQGAEPIGSTPEQLAAVLANDIAKYAKVMKVAGVQPE